MANSKILVVEDEAPLRELIQEILKNAGFDVYTAANGQEGFTQAQNTKPDVILSDVIMPTMDGNIMLKKLRETAFGKNIPFIVLTARGGMKDYFEVMGVDGFIEKPFQPQDLVTEIHSVMAEHKNQKQSSVEGSFSKQKKGEESEAQTDITISRDQEILIKSSAIDIESVKKQDEEEDVKKQEQVQKAKISIGTGAKRIIIFGNDMDEFCELQRQFSKSGYASELVCTFDECLMETRRVKPNLIIIKDLPGVINGEETANSLRQNPSSREIPIVVYGDIGSREQLPNSSGNETIFVFSFNAQGKNLINKVQDLLK